MEKIQLFLLELIKSHGVKVILIVAIFILGEGALKWIVKRIIKVASQSDKIDEQTLRQRTKTLKHIISTGGNVAIFVIILLMVLSLFGVDIKPILAGAGILGLAVGFGAQALVKDLISGLFILMESQYNIGDQVLIGGFEGRVIKITVRSTVLQNDEGKIFYITNGSVNNIINLSQGKNQNEKEVK